MSIPEKNLLHTQNFFCALSIALVRLYRKNPKNVHHVEPFLLDKATKAENCSFLFFFKRTMWTTFTLLLIKIFEFGKTPLIEVKDMKNSWQHANFRKLPLTRSKITASQTYVMILGLRNFYVLKISGKISLCPDLNHFRFEFGRFQGRVLEVGCCPNRHINLRPWGLTQPSGQHMQGQNCQGQK